MTRDSTGELYFSPDGFARSCASQLAAVLATGSAAGSARASADAGPGERPGRPEADGRIPIPEERDEHVLRLRTEHARGGIHRRGTKHGGCRPVGSELTDQWSGRRGLDGAEGSEGPG